ncbi:MAG TPA: hypothetical protein VJ925_00505, partial [Longimicrobiales bacterium]|nr:hypothetical protein [Longimicrobiales bacterium]
MHCVPALARGRGLRGLQFEFEVAVPIRLGLDPCLSEPGGDRGIGQTPACDTATQVREFADQRPVREARAPAGLSEDPAREIQTVGRPVSAERLDDHPFEPAPIPSYRACDDAKSPTYGVVAALEGTG